MFSKMMLAGDLGSLNTYTETIVITGTGPVNLRTLADNHSNPYNGTDITDITWTFASDITITGAESGGDGIDTGVWPSEVTHSHRLEVAGTSRGGGGRGGAGGDGPDDPGLPGTNGGDAINCQEDIEIIVEIGGLLQAAGGGGGGGGGAAADTGAPEVEFGGGGGGGGFPNGFGGVGGVGDVDGFSGSPGTPSGGGDGGIGGELGGRGGDGGNVNVDGVVGFDGEGKDGEGPGGAAGIKGFAIRKNGHSVPVTNNGTITGEQG